MTKKELKDFESDVAALFHQGKLPFPIHFSGGNEDKLIEIFENIKEEDWVFSTWRSHFHYLLKSGDKEGLLNKILHGQSMHVMDPDNNFFASSIVGGTGPIAVGVALSLKMEKAPGHVYCFVGDGAEDQGVFYESVRYAAAWKLPITFIIEDNGLSVDTTKQERVNNFCIDWPDNVIRYSYEREYPHVQTGQMVKEYM